MYHACSCYQAVMQFGNIIYFKGFCDQPNIYLVKQHVTVLIQIGYGIGQCNLNSFSFRQITYFYKYHCRNINFASFLSASINKDLAFCGILLFPIQRTIAIVSVTNTSMLFVRINGFIVNEFLLQVIDLRGIKFCEAGLYGIGYQAGFFKFKKLDEIKYFLQYIGRKPL